MGIEDRDWYREAQRDRSENGRYSKKYSKPRNGLLIAFFWVSLLFLLFHLSKRFERVTFKLPFASISQSDTVEHLPVIPSVTEVRQQPRPPNKVEEVQTRVVQEPIAQTPPPPSTITIYRCKAYAGGIFWSTAYCGTQKASIDRTASVPNGLPFEQQVQIAEAQRLEAMALYSPQPAATVQKSDRCIALKKERDVIESRYSNWQWQPLEVINPDQTRMKGLRAEQARLGCPTQ